MAGPGRAEPEGTRSLTWRRNDIDFSYVGAEKSAVRQVCGDAWCCHLCFPCEFGTAYGG